MRIVSDVATSMASGKPRTGGGLSSGAAPGPNPVALAAKSLLNGCLGFFGLQLGRKHSPFLEGSARVSGSFPSYAELHEIGRRENYYIHDGYRHRTQYAYYDDRSNSDGWQNEVYVYAREIADAHRLDTVIDIGCGSAFKLLKYFKDCKTIGLDVPETFETLRRRYPERHWAISNFSDPHPPQAQLVIASDVIEHLLDPDALLEYILTIQPRYVIISTPDRNLMRAGTGNGMPANPHHMREWSMAELHAYLAEYLEIDEHFHSNAAQWTQCVLGRPKASRAGRSGPHAHS